MPRIAKSRISSKSSKYVPFFQCSLNWYSDVSIKAFRTLSKGLSSLADEAESFESKAVFGLLRSAPDLLPHIKHVRKMFKTTDESMCFSVYFLRLLD